MKLWFGKKGTGKLASGETTGDVLVIEDLNEPVAPPPPAPVQPPPRPGVPEAAAKPAAVPAPAADGRASEERKPAGAEAPPPPSATEQQVKEQTAQSISEGKGAAVNIQAPVNLAQGRGLGLGQGAESGKPARPVLTPVRMSSPTEPIRLKPVSATPASVPVPAAPGLAPAGGGAPGVLRATGAFGLRPKEGVVTLGAPAAAGAPAEPAAVPAAPEAGAPPSAAEKSGAPERDADGVVRPKTDQRALYYQLMNGLYDAVLILDDQGHIVDCNVRVTEMLGYAREDAWDLPIDKVITGMSNQMFEHLKRNLAENHHILIDARCFRQDGTSFAGEVGVSTLSLTRGSNIVFAIRNVDRRKNAMDEMRKGQSALEVSLAPSFVCDLDGFFVVVNQALLDAFGIPDEAQAKNVRFIDLLPDAARFFLRASCGEKLRESLQVPTPAGIPLKVELALKPVQNGQTVTGVAGSILQV